MGFNTSVVVLNDALQYIKDDPEFGKKLAEAIGKLSLPPEHRGERGGSWGVDVSAGMHANAATAIESHHADYESIIAFGGNMGRILSPAIRPYGKEGDSVEVKYLRELADQLGFTLRKKPQRKA